MERGSLCQIYSQIDFTWTNLASVWQALLCTHAWAFVVKVGIPWMFTEWIKGLMGYEAKSFVWMQRSVKRKNIPTLGNLPTPAHHVTGLWALLTGATEWVLSQAQLWTGQHWKHTHVDMHHTNGDPSIPLSASCTHTARGQAQAPELWGSLLLQGDISLSSSYHYPVRRGARARVIGTDIQMAHGLFSVPRLHANVCLREWKGSGQLSWSQIH